MNKSQQIKEFIRKKPRTRSEITKFIKVTIGPIKEEDYNPKDWVGNYGNGLSAFRRNGHIEIINRLYELTEFGKKTKLGMYQEIPEYKADYWFKKYIDQYHSRKEYQHELTKAEIEIKRLKRKLKKFRKPKFIINIIQES